MKIFFSMRHSGALRNYSSTVEELAQRGHQIHLTFMMRDKLRRSAAARSAHGNVSAHHSRLGGGVEARLARHGSRDTVDG